MSDDYRSYQSADTAWRYDEQLAQAFYQIASLEADLEEWYATARRLKANPPLYHLFNWSA